MTKQYYASLNINEGSFESLQNIMDTTFEMNYDRKQMPSDGIPIISDGHTARGYFPEQPMMIVAATGSGKTRRLIIEYLISCIMDGNSFIANDPKGELFKHVYKSLKKNGYDIYALDYRDTACGDRYNLCECPAKLYKKGNTARADELFQSMFDTLLDAVKSEKDPFWHITAASYLTGLAELACDILPVEMVTINNIFELHIQGKKRFGTGTYLQTYMEMHEDKPYFKLISAYTTAPTDTRGSLDSVLLSAISKLCRNESVVDQTTQSTFSAENLVEQKSALFLVSRDESTVYNSLISAVVSQLYETVTDIAEEKYNGRLKRRLTIILDEFGNLAPICDINEKITVSRSRNIGWCLGCQSLDQLNLKYGQDVSKIIIGNCNIAYLYSNDINLLKMISELCGKTTDEYTNETRQLLSIEQLRHFNKKEGQILFLLERLRPFIGFLPDISEYKVVPLQKAEYPKRELQELTRINFVDIVNDEKKRNAEEPKSKYQGFQERPLFSEKIQGGAKANACYVVIDSMESMRLTETVFRKFSGLPAETVERTLNCALTRGNRQIEISTKKQAELLVKALRDVGTEAFVRVEELV